MAGKGYARALRIDATRQLTVADQFNARDADTPIASALPLDLDGDGEMDVRQSEPWNNSIPQWVLFSW